MIYSKLYHLDDTHKRIFTNEEELERRRKVNSSSVISTKYSRPKNVRWQCSQLKFSFAPHVMQPTLSSRNTSNFLLILITSGVGKLNSERRNGVRRTWGDKSINSDRRNWELVFVIGKALSARHSEEIRKEAAFSKDILALNMTDSYNN